MIPQPIKTTWPESPNCKTCGDKTEQTARECFFNLGARSAFNVEPDYVYYHICRNPNCPQSVQRSDYKEDA